MTNKRNKTRCKNWRPVFVRDADGYLIGQVGLIHPDKGELKFAIFDVEEKKIVYTITRDGLSAPVSFPIYQDMTNIQIASICCNYGPFGVTVTFPKGMSTKHKALILSAVFLLESTFKRYFPKEGGFASAIWNGRGWQETGLWCC